MHFKSICHQEVMVCIFYISNPEFDSLYYLNYTLLLNILKLITGGFDNFVFNHDRTFCLLFRIKNFKFKLNTSIRCRDASNEEKATTSRGVV